MKSRIFLTALAALGLALGSADSAAAGLAGRPLNQGLSAIRKQAGALKEKPKDLPKRYVYTPSPGGREVALEVDPRKAVLYLQPGAKPDRALVKPLWESGRDPVAWGVSLEGPDAVGPDIVEKHPEWFRYSLPAFRVDGRFEASLTSHISAGFEDGVDPEAFVSPLGLKVVEKVGIKGKPRYRLALKDGPVTADRIFQALEKLQDAGRKEGGLRFASPTLRVRMAPPGR